MRRLTNYSSEGNFQSLAAGESSVAFTGLDSSGYGKRVLQPKTYTSVIPRKGSTHNRSLTTKGTRDRVGVLERKSSSRYTIPAIANRADKEENSVIQREAILLAPKDAICGRQNYYG